MNNVTGIDYLKVSGFKSLMDFSIENLTPLTVFAGPNASGKSNIFEAVEFFMTFVNAGDMKIFGTEKEIINFNNQQKKIYFEIGSRTGSYNSLKTVFSFENDVNHYQGMVKERENISKVFNNFTRLFINNYQINRPKYRDDSKLDFYASNLEKVLKRLLTDKEKKDELVENLRFFIPEFESIDVVSSELSGTDSLIVYEKNSKKPFPRNLLSDGTYNIIALLVAVMQSDEPQFLCIEEPENGLHPKVTGELINFFKDECERKGHIIWITTHSPSVISELTPGELVVVDKIDGKTISKQFAGNDFFDIKLDVAWLSNVLGGGLPW
jgi:predicted ATPase